MAILAAKFRMPPVGVLTAGPKNRQGWEILRVERGEGDFYSQAGKQPLQQGTLLIIPPCVEYHILPAKDYVDISVELSEAIIPGEEAVLQLRDDLHGTAGKLMGMLRDCYVEPSTRHAIYAASLQRAFQDLLTAWLQRQPSPELSRLTELMRDNVPNPDFNIAQAIDSIPQSRGYTRQQFKATYGCTPTAYLNRLRVEVSKLYLASSQRSIAEVAYLCGFRDAKYFTRIFHRLTGMTPSQFISANAAPSEPSEP